jgi:hypothetical protein
MPNHYKYCLWMLLFGFFACGKRPPKEPVLTYKSISKYILNQNRQDSVLVEFGFTDGDGDLGSSTDYQIFVRDDRTDSIVGQYKIPPFDNPDKKICREGTMRVIVYAGCCIYPNRTSCYPNASIPLDSVKYKVQVQDRAGNVSNMIETELIQLDCTR